MRLLTALRVDPRNREIFDPLDGRDLEELADSLRANGMINPITIRPDGLIIAGEQRYRAAGLAGLAEVPVVVLDVPDDQVEVLRIEENLRRRTLKPSETARAIRRLYTIHGITERKGAGRPETVIGAVTAPITDEAEPIATGPEVTVADIAARVDLKPRQVKTLNRLADLIAPLAALLDSGAISQDIAYQLAQLRPDDQAMIARLHTVAPAALDSPIEVQDMKRRLKDAEGRDAEVARLTAEAERAEADKAAALNELRAEMAAEIQELTEAKNKAEEEKRKLEEEKERVEHWRRYDKVHQFIERANVVMTADPRAAAHSLQGIAALRIFLENDKATADALALWAGAYARALGERLDDASPTPQLRSVK